MPLPNPDHPDTAEDSPADRPRFVNWLGFLLVGMLVNGLFVWGMWGVAADPAAPHSSPRDAAFLHFDQPGDPGMTLADLNTRFGIADQLKFIEGPGGLTFAEIDNAQGTAYVCLQGA
ncbi:MAG: hypothetical protein MUE86_06010, partial [Thiobacillaceae bacterium]|nr:hypothetical protein [Thiobacillaceae bacterium]